MERPTPPPSADLDIGKWVLATVAYVFSDEAPCGKAATHVAFWGKPLCEAHADALRKRLRDGDTLAGILKQGSDGGRLSDADIARLVRPLEGVQ
jgi:hypothetical protein